MPELPEVEAITSRAHRAVGKTITQVEVIRQNGKYFGDGRLPVGWHVSNVSRIGKRVVFDTVHEYIVVHNAMSGYIDWDDDPWTFDYVEGKRLSKDSDVRVRMTFDDGSILRYHDTRLFGSIRLSPSLPDVVPEPMLTLHANVSVPVMGPEDFSVGLRNRLEPIKHVLMDQEFIAGVGNIYANEACLVAMIDPIWPACALSREQSFLLYEALRTVLSLNIPKINYGWLNSYRRNNCGFCGEKIFREKLRGRATFSCPRCQWEAS